MIALPLPRGFVLAGVTAWGAVALAALWSVEPSARVAAWAGVDALFLACFLLNASRARASLAAVGVQSASVITMVALVCNGYEGLLLVLVAAQLARSADRTLGFTWIMLQTVAVAIGVGMKWAVGAALLLMAPYLGFQLLMFVALRQFFEERHTSERLTAANEELRRLQSELAAKARVEERLRLAQDMHDVLGHRLVALGLNLEFAAHGSDGAVRTAVRTCQSLAHALFWDVKTLVRSADDERPVDLEHELRQLAHELRSPKLHIDLSPALCISDTRTRRALLRVIQEIVTNSIRHGEASNLWISIERNGDRLTLVARDDGAPSDCGAEGLGLTGMRRRLEELGGTLSAAPASAGGFEVRAEVPCRPEEMA